MASGKKRNTKGLFSILLGVLLLCAALGLTLYNKWESDKAGAASREVVELLSEQIISQASSALSNPSSGKPAELAPLQGVREMPTTKIFSYDYIGIIEIPSLKIQLPVMDQWDYNRLNVAPCLYSGSYFTGDMVICAHNFETHFSPIKSIALGEEVFFTTADGMVLNYRVVDVQTLGKFDTIEMVESSQEWDLTLFTCNTGGTTRCTVRCQRVYG